MAQRLNKTLVVLLTLAGMGAMTIGGVLMILYLPAKDPGPLLAQAQGLAQKGAFERAAVAYMSAAEAARKVKEGNDHFGKANDYLLLAGDMALQAGRTGDALNSWNRVLRDDRTNQAAQLRIVDMYVGTYRPFGIAPWETLEKEARKLCEMNKAKPNPCGLATLGLALVKQGKPENMEEGERLLKEAVARLKEDVVATPGDPKVAKDVAKAAEYLSEAAEYLSSFYVQSARQILNGPQPESNYPQLDARLAEAEKVYETLPDKLAKALANLREELGGLRNKSAGLPKNAPDRAKLEDEIRDEANQVDRVGAALIAAFSYRGQCYLSLRQLAAVRLALIGAGRALAGSEADVQKQLANADKQALESFEEAIKVGKDEAERNRKAEPDKKDEKDYRYEKGYRGIGQYWANKPSLEKDPAKRQAELQANWAKAKEAFEQAIFVAPNSFDAYVDLAQLNRYTGNPAKAAEVLDKRLGRQRQRGWTERFDKQGLNSLRALAFEIRLAEAQTLKRDSEDYSKVVKRLNELRAEYANDVEGGDQSARVKFMQAQLLFLNEKYAEALKLAQEADDATAHSEPEIILVLAQLYLRTGAPGKAEEILRKATQGSKALENSDTAWLVLAKLQLGLGNPDEALRSAERCLALNSQNKEALRVKLAVYAQKNNTQEVEKLQAQLGIQTQPGAKKVQEAVDLWRQAKNVESPDAETQKKVVALLQAALAEDPTYFEALRRLAIILSPQPDDSEDVKAGKIKQLKAAIDTALAVVNKKAAETPATQATQPGTGQSTPDYSRLATSIRQLNLFTAPATNRAERLRIQEEAIKQEADPFEQAIGLATLYSSYGKTAEAIAQLKKAGEHMAQVRKEAEAKAQLAEAEKAKEKEKDVAEYLFSEALRAKEFWSTAEETIPKLQALGTNEASVRMHRARLALARAEAAEQERNPQEAKAQASTAKGQLETSLKEFPNDAEACTFLGLACRILGDLDAAQQWLSKSLELNPQNGLTLSVLYQVAGLRRDEALQAVVIRKLRAVEPNNLLVRQADEAAEDARDPAAAIARRERFATANPDDVNNLLTLANLYARTNQDDKAKSTYQQCREKDKENLLVIGNYADYLRNKNPPELAAAEQVLQQALTGVTDPLKKATVQLMLAGHGEELLRRGAPNAPSLESVKASYEAAAKIKEDPNVLVDIANFYGRANQPREAENKLRQAIAISNAPESRETNRIIRQTLIRRLMSTPEDRYGEIESEIKAYGEKFDDGFGLLAHSDLAMATGRVPEAMEDLNAYIRKSPRDVVGYFSRGRLYYQRGDINKAIEDFQKAVEIDPRALNYQHRQLLAQCLAMTNQSDLAKTQLSAIVQEDPNAGSVVKQLADLYASEKQWNQAEALILPRARDPNNPDRLFWMSMLASLYKAQKDMTKAIQAARETAEVSKYQLGTLDGFGDMCINSGQAREFIDVVTEKVPAETQKHPIVQLRLAEAYAAAKNVPKALEIYGQLLDTAKGQFSSVVTVAMRLSRSVPKDGADWLAKRQAAKPDDRSLQFALGVFQVETKDYAAGMKNLNTLLAQTTGADDRSKAEKAELLRYMSIAAHNQKDFASARKLYEELLTIEPQNPTISNNLAYLLMTEFKEPDKAQALAETAVRNLPPNAPGQNKAVLYDTLGWCLVTRGNLDAGIARLQQAANLAQSGAGELDYVLAGIYYHAAEGYFRRSTAPGNKNSAYDNTESGLACRRAWQFLKTANPSDPDHLREALQTLASKLKIDLETVATSQPAKNS